MEGWTDGWLDDRRDRLTNRERERERERELVQSLFCMVFFGGLTVTSHHFQLKNVFKVDFLLTVYDYNYKWVKKNYLRKKILQAY